MERVREALLDEIVGGGAARELPSRPGHVRRDRRHAPRVGQLAHGEGRVRIEAQDEIALLAKHQLAADDARAVRIGLIVLDDQLDRVRLAADLQPVLEGRPNALDRPRRRFAEIRADPGLRPDEADLEGSRLGPGDVDVERDGGGGEPRHSAGLEKRAPADLRLRPDSSWPLRHSDLLVEPRRASIHARVAGASPERRHSRRPPDPWRGV
jgi:hypothetical protein